jgi:hypothetical protein
MKYLLIGILAVATGYASSLPERFNESEFHEGDYFRYFGQHIQKSDGTFTDEMGRILIQKSDESFTVAFFLKSGPVFTRIGEPVILRDTFPPHASVISEPQVPTIAAKKKDGTGKIHLFVERGVLKQKESKE